MEAAYSELFDHYYRLGEVDSLRIVGYELMDWYTRRNKKDERYQLWRHYIQRLTENGKQDEAIAETELLSKDAEKNNSRYGQAAMKCVSDIIIGYSVITSNSVLNIITMLLRFLRKPNTTKMPTWFA